MGHRILEKCRGVAVLAATLALGGCGFKIAAPVAGAYERNPVPAQIDWSADLQANTFKVVVDPASSNQDVTNAFAIAPISGGFTAKGILPGLPQGPHTVKVSGNLFVWYTRQYSNTSSQSSFEVIVPKK